jgi:hypothetical protein
MAPPLESAEFDSKMFLDMTGLEESQHMMAPPTPPVVAEFDSKVLLDKVGLE